MELALPDGVFDLDHQRPTNELWVRRMPGNRFSDRKRPRNAEYIFIAHDLAVNGFVLEEARGSFHGNRCCRMLLTGGESLRSDSSVSRRFSQFVLPSSAWIAS